MEYQSGDNHLSERQGTGSLAVIKSVIAAAFGVQSKSNKERDFQHGKPLHFIVGGLVFTLVFILVIALIVRVLLSSS